MSERKDPIKNEGYVSTQLGPKTIQLPPDWEVHRLGEIATINMGSSPKSKYYNEDQEGLPFFQGNADFGFKHPQATVWCTKPKKTADVRDLLLSVRAPVGDLNIADQDCCIGRGLTAISGDEIDSQLLYHLPHFEKSRLQSYSQGSTFNSINSGILDGFPIQYPPLSEQRRIADILSTVDEQIQQTGELVNKTKELKQAVLQDFYISPEVDTVTPESPTRAPEEWEAKRIEEICDIGGGSTPKRSNEVFWNGSTPWVSPKEFDEQGIIRDTQDHVTQEGVNDSSLTVYPPGTTVVTVRSNAIKRRLPIAKITTEATVNQDIKALVPDEDEVLPEYLFQILKYNSERIRLTCRKSGTIIDSIDTGFLKSYRIMIPDLNVQKRISGILTTIDNKVEQEKEHKGELQELKRGLMQDLLTGKVRTPPDLGDGAATSDT